MENKNKTIEGIFEIVNCSKASYGIYSTIWKNKVINSVRSWLDCLHSELKSEVKVQHVELISKPQFAIYT